MRSLISISVILISLTSFSQDIRIISGTVSDSLTLKAIPFATISLKNKMLGATSNEQGSFRLKLPSDVDSDTLIISSMGYKSFSIAVSKVKEELNVSMASQVFNIDEVVIKPYPPEHYIKLVQKNMAKNYVNTAFETQAFYREQLLEDNEPVLHSEAIFRSYYPEYNGKKPNQHQVALYRQRDDIRELEFMKERREKHERKRMKKAKKKGKEISDEEMQIIQSFGGPDNLLDLNFIKRPHLFLDSAHFKKYDYSFETNTVFDGHDIMVISFNANRNIQNMRTKGKVYIDMDSYAIASLEYYGHAIIPTIVKPILFAYGLGIKNPIYDVRLNFREFNDLWYPDQVFMDLKVDLTHKKMFSKNIHSRFDMEGFFGVNSFKLNEVVPISEGKRFDGKKEMKEQVFPEPGITWEGVSVVTKRE